MKPGTVVYRHAKGDVYTDERSKAFGRWEHLRYCSGDWVIYSIPEAIFGAAVYKFYGYDGFYAVEWLGWEPDKDGTNPMCKIRIDSGPYPTLAAAKTVVRLMESTERKS